MWSSAAGATEASFANGWSSYVSSSCTASEAGVSGSTTITNGTLQTSETGGPGGTPIVVAIPTNPAPNTTYNGMIESVGDTFRYVFNEQIVNPDGSLTVNAAHEYLLGPTAVGDLIIGRSVCGVTATTTAVTFRSLTAVAVSKGVRSHRAHAGRFRARREACHAAD